MSMLKKLMVVAGLVVTAVPVLAADASDGAQAAREVREESAARNRGGPSSVGAGDVRGNSSSKDGVRSTRDARCNCRCAPNGAGYGSDPDSTPSYGG